MQSAINPVDGQLNLRGLSQTQVVALIQSTVGDLINNYSALSALSEHITRVLTKSATIAQAGESISAHAVYANNYSIPGAVVGDVVVVTCTTPLQNDYFLWRGYVIAADVVRVVVSNTSASPQIFPTNATFKVVVMG